MLAMPGIASAQEETFSMTGLVPVPGLASFDISWVDSTLNGGTYFLADRSNKEIVSYIIPTGAIGAFKSGNLVGAFLTAAGTVNNDLSGPNGVLTFANSANSGHTEIWIGDGPQVNYGCPSYLNESCSTTKVLDYTAGGALIHVIPTNGAARADELCHDSVDHLVMIANDAEKDFSFGTPFVTWISTDTYKVVAQMTIPQASNGIEQCQYDHTTGNFFLNLPEANGPGNDTAPGNVLEISPPTAANGFKASVLATYVIPLADCAGPQGMAIGPNPQLLLGCNAVGPNGVRNSVVINKTNGAVLNIGWGIGGADEVWFNPGDSHYYVTGSSATPQRLAVVDGIGPGSGGAVAGAVDQLIPTPTMGGGASHSVAADYNTNKFFVPTGGGVLIFTPSGLDSDDANIISTYPGLPE
jgi:hypothetical protein